MDPKELFARAVQQGTTCVRYVADEHLTNSTPCTEWDLKALLNHMVYELMWVRNIVLGKTVEEVGDRYDHGVLSSNLHSNWQHAADSALVAVKNADLNAPAHLSYADVPMAQYIQEIAGDIFVHTWDVSRGLHCTLQLDEDVAREVYNFFKPRSQEIRDSGGVGPEVPVPQDASVQTRLIGFFGRRPDWGYEAS